MARNMYLWASQTAALHNYIHLHHISDIKKEFARHWKQSVKPTLFKHVFVPHS